MILFKIPGTGPFTIQPLTPLPAITHTVFIDGYSQAGARLNKLTQGDNATIMIGLDGTVAGGDGLLIAAGGSTVVGLALTRFENGIHLTSAGGDLIDGDFLGTEPSGAVVTGGNGTGVRVEGPGGNWIGGTNPAARDLISANDQQGILIDGGSTGNRVQGDLIGIDITGEARLGNGLGVVLTDAPGNSIGGARRRRRQRHLGQHQRRHRDGQLHGLRAGIAQHGDPRQLHRDRRHRRGRPG
jgi:hypothetical protein